MRRLAQLCRKLHRVTGFHYVVVSRSRNCYRVYKSDGLYGLEPFPFPGCFFTTVRECESFLNSLFR